MESTIADTPILSLPTELTVPVFRKLKLRSLLRCAQVCRRWCTLVRDTDELQYQIELEIHEVQDNCPENMSITRRLRLLRDKQTAWRTGMGDILSVMKLAASAPFTWRFNGDSIVYVDQAERRVCYKPFGPGSLSARVSEWQWHLPDIGDYATLSFDPDQDLVAIAWLATIQTKVHVSILLRSATTGEPHPLAVRSGELRASFTFEIGAIETPGFCILGDLVSISILRFDYDTPNDYGSVTIVWNWKTGVLQRRIRGMRTNLALMMEGRAMIWDTKISTTNGPAPGLAVHSLRKGATSVECLAGSDYDYALLMPPFLFDSPNVRRHEVKLYSPRTHRRSSMFPPAPDADNLITIDMGGFHESAGRQTRRLLISQKKLMATLQEKPDNSQQFVLPWDQWKACVVWASEESNREPLEPQTTAGMRYMEQSSSVHCGSELNVLDFNALRVARAVSTGMQFGEQLVSADTRFDDELILGQPYLKKRVNVTHHYGCCILANFISDDGLFIVTEDTALVARNPMTINAVPLVNA